MRGGENIRGVFLTSKAALAIAIATRRLDVMETLEELLPGPAHEETRREGDEAMRAIQREARTYAATVNDARNRRKVESAKGTEPQTGGGSEWMTTTQAAELMDRTPQRVLQLQAEGRLNGRRERNKPAGRWLFPASDVRAWVASQGLAGLDGSDGTPAGPTNPTFNHHEHKETK